jgi:hypothetical protein
MLSTGLPSTSVTSACAEPCAAGVPTNVPTCARTVPTAGQAPARGAVVPAVMPDTVRVGRAARGTASRTPQDRVHDQYAYTAHHKRHHDTRRSRRAHRPSSTRVASAARRPAAHQRGSQHRATARGTSRQDAVQPAGGHPASQASKSRRALAAVSETCDASSRDGRLEAHGLRPPRGALPRAPGQPAGVTREPRADRKIQAAEPRLPAHQPSLLPSPPSTCLPASQLQVPVPPGTRAPSRPAPRTPPASQTQWYLLRDTEKAAATRLRTTTAAVTLGR